MLKKFSDLMKIFRTLDLVFEVFVFLILISNRQQWQYGGSANCTVGDTRTALLNWHFQCVGIA
jgi:hypothetical protein